MTSDRGHATGREGERTPSRGEEGRTSTRGTGGTWYVRTHGARHTTHTHASNGNGNGNTSQNPSWPSETRARLGKTPAAHRVTAAVKTGRGAARGPAPTRRRLLRCSDTHATCSACAGRRQRAQRLEPLLLVSRLGGGNRSGAAQGRQQRAERRALSAQLQEIRECSALVYIGSRLPFWLGAGRWCCPALARLSGLG